MRLPALLLFAAALSAAEPEFPLTPDSQPQTNVPKGTLIKDTYTAGEGSVFPGTVREYQIYLPSGFDKSQPSPFMVFQDGVIYQAPVVFDNLIAKKDIPPLVGIFIKPGVVPAANDNALPRYNRSYEYDSVTDTYSRFLIEEFLPALEKKHHIKFSTDPNDTAIAGNSSGGICAFMVGWHRPDRFRRIFTGVGTYVGIHGADQLPVLVRKIEPKPLRVFLQSGTGDNNLYCGDWWMANQMMERSLTWAGYEVNHAWGEGGHNQKHASQIFPDAMRWLWRDWQKDKAVKANVKGESKWKGYEVVENGSNWQTILTGAENECQALAPNKDGEVATGGRSGKVQLIRPASKPVVFAEVNMDIHAMAFAKDGSLFIHANDQKLGVEKALFQCQSGKPAIRLKLAGFRSESLLADHEGHVWIGAGVGGNYPVVGDSPLRVGELSVAELNWPILMCLSPDQSLVYGYDHGEVTVGMRANRDQLRHMQSFFILEPGTEYLYPRGPSFGKMCVDTEGRLYVATERGIQVCDQAGRVNFIIPTPKPPYDVCFGGKDLSDLFIACGDTVCKRRTKVHGIVSGQMPPIKPAPPKL